MDYAGFLKDFYHGKGMIPTGPIPKGLLGYNPAHKTYYYDPKKAAEYFRKAFGGKVWDTGFRFSIAYNSGNTPRQTVAQILKRNVEAINPKFHIDLRGVEWPTFLDAQNASKLPMWVMAWHADFPDPHNFAFPFLHSLGDYPPIQKFKYPEMDRLVEEGEHELDPAKRKAIYAKLNDMAYDEVTQVYVLQPIVVRAQRDWVKGYSYNPMFPDSPYSTYYYSISKSQ